MSSDSKKSSVKLRRRSAARLAAVQALYQVELTNATPDGIIRDFAERLLGGEAVIDLGEDGEEMTAELLEPDMELFTFLVRGALAQSDQVDEMIGKALSGAWSTDRLEPIVLAILRTGAYEIKERSDVPPRVAITEYVDIAHAFYSGQEPGLVNAVLDRVARVLRSESFDEGSGA